MLNSSTAYVFALAFAVANCYHWEVCILKTHVCEASGGGAGYYTIMKFNGITLWTTESDPVVMSGEGDITCSNCCAIYGPASSNIELTFEVWDEVPLFFDTQILSDTWSTPSAGNWYALENSGSCTESVYYSVVDLEVTPSPIAQYNDLELYSDTVLDWIADGSISTVEECKTQCEGNANCKYLSFGNLQITSSGKSFQGDFKFNQCQPSFLCEDKKCVTFAEYDSYATTSGATTISYDGLITAPPTVATTTTPTSPPTASVIEPATSTPTTATPTSAVPTTAFPTTATPTALPTAPTSSEQTTVEPAADLSSSITFVWKFNLFFVTFVVVMICL